MDKLRRYNCGTDIEWDTEQAAFKETLTGMYHNKDRCAKLKQSNGSQTTQTYQNYKPQQNQQLQTTTGSVDRPSLEATLLNQISKSVQELKSQMEQQIANTLGECCELARNNNMMLDALVAYFKLTQPTKASDLYNQNQQPEDPEIKGWNSDYGDNIATGEDNSV